MSDISWAEAKALLQSGEWDAARFVHEMADTPLYYSTPAGENRAGEKKLYLLSRSGLPGIYQPAFLTAGSCRDFFTMLERLGFVVIQGTLAGLLSLLDSLPMKELGVVVEPGGPSPVVIPPGLRAAHRRPE